MSKAHTVVVILEAKEGGVDILGAALEAIVAPSRAEKTCKEYRLHKSTAKPNQFLLYENWESEEAHQEQFEKPYFKTLLDKVSEVLIQPYQTFFGEEIE